MVIDQELFSALRLVQEDATAKRVFDLVCDRLGISGWALAKTLDQDPKQTELSLRKLTEGGILRTPDTGLEGNYSLTGLGFALKEQLSARRFAR